MNLYVLVFLLAILVFGFGSTIFWRGGIVVLMLLPASEFLGFVDPMKIAVKGLFDIHALILLTIITATAVSIFHLGDLFSAKLSPPIFIFFLFWAYGVFIPLINEHSTFFYTIKSSKEFLTIFSFIAVLLFVRTKNDVNLGWKILIGLGLYYSILEILGQFLGPFLKSKISYHMRMEDGFFWKIYAPFWPVILLAFFNFYYSQALKYSQPYVKLSISAIGILLTFFRSYLLASLVALPIVHLITGQGFVKTVSRTALLFFSICFCLIMIATATLTTGSKFASVGKIVDKFFISAVREITTQSGGSLKGRERVTASRKMLLDKKSFTGYGFIDKESKFGKQIKLSNKVSNLGFIDKGILDIPIKFGYIGFAALVVNIFYVIFILRKMSLASEDKQFKIRCMSVAAMIISFLLVLPVHAPLTYSYGLLPLGISLGLIERERYLLAEEGPPE